MTSHWKFGVAFPVKLLQLLQVGWAPLLYSSLYIKPEILRQNDGLGSKWFIQRHLNYYYLNCRNVTLLLSSKNNGWSLKAPNPIVKSIYYLVHSWKVPLSLHCWLGPAGKWKSAGSWEQDTNVLVFLGTVASCLVLKRLVSQVWFSSNNLLFLLLNIYDRTFLKLKRSVN